jgi:hypothetical protein
MAGSTATTGNSRQCGDCSLCCKVLRIAELDKPKDSWCPNFEHHVGCRIYADRPPSCRTFMCRWLVDPSMGPEWKPSVCKMVLDAKPNLVIVHVDPAAGKPWRAEPYSSVLKRLAAQGIEKGVMVMVIEHHRTIVILPDREVDMGVMGPGTRIQIKRVMTPDGPQWQPRVMGAVEQGSHSGSA